MVQRELITEEQVRLHFSNSFEGKALDEVVRKYMSAEPLFPEKVKRANESLALMDPEALDSILNRSRKK
jgi:hypothetical protein